MSDSGFTDFHQHVLWGLDDGPKTAKQMYAMLERAAADGIRLIAATSHAYPETREFNAAKYRKRLAEANEYCRQRQLALKVISGCEIHYSDRVPDLLRSNRLPTIGGTRVALIEFDYDASLEEIGEAADKLYRAGCRMMVAHIERYRSAVRSPGKAMELREEYGLYYQMNCNTVLHPRGLLGKRFVRRMLEARAIDLVATDAHDTERRPVCMKAAHAELTKRCGRKYAKKLVTFGRKLAGRQAEQG